MVLVMMMMEMVMIDDDDNDDVALPHPYVIEVGVERRNKSLCETPNMIIGQNKQW